MDRRTPDHKPKKAPARAAFTTTVAAALAMLAGITAAASAETLGSCKTCREYNRACVQAHSKQACKSELDICLKHCKQK
jgi:hypothetical protein